MIVVGYQGIGKSTLAGKNHQYIDLESGNFWVDGKRADDWYKPYCQIAEHLSQQGYVVFTSSHEVVRNQLAKSSETVVVVHPAPHLKDEWIKKLHDRWQITGLDKDYKAYMNALDRYTENIQELKTCDIPYKLEISVIDYDLEALLDYLVEEAAEPTYEDKTKRLKDYIKTATYALINDVRREKFGSKG